MKIYILIICYVFSALTYINAQETIRVLYVGDAGVVLGPNIVASPFYYEQKGYEVHIWCQPVLDALNAQNDIRCDHMATWDAVKYFPETAEELKSKYDVVILSDIEQECLVLYEWERMLKCPMGPNRVEEIKKYVEMGGGLIMIGGWQSFTGRRGIGDWGDTAVEEALPVTCLKVNDDRREVPQGVRIRSMNIDHPLIKGFEWDNGPLFTGYNRFEAKPEARVLAKVEGYNDPFIVVWDFGKGRSMAFASDVSPHWGVGFQAWDKYDEFFVKTVRWLAGKL